MTPGARTLTISPLPAAVAEIPPAIAAVEVTPAPGLYPHAATAGQPFEIGVRAFTPAATAPLRGVLRWRKALSPRWQEEPLHALADNEFSGRWTPEEPGDYEWCVELWAGDDGQTRPGSSGAEVLHLLRASRANLAAARWRKAARIPLAKLHPAPGDGADVLLLPPIFPHARDGRTGRDGNGHYSIDPDLGDTRDFGELSAAARRAGVTLALTLPLDCSPQHPLHQNQPDAFRADGSLDWTGSGWHKLWSAWEAVFRFWVVQGIDLFHIPAPGAAPVSFWDTLIGRLRDDFPATLFTADPGELASFGEHLLGVGFLPAPAEFLPGADPLAVRRGAPADTGHAPAPTLAPLPPLPPDRDDDGVDDGTDDNGREAEPAPPPEVGRTLACSCSNEALTPTLRRSGGSLVLEIDNRDPSSGQSGHVHFDGAELELSEHELYYLRDLADGKAYRWSGTTNFLALAPGERAKTFRVERT